MFGCCRPTRGADQFEEIIAPPSNGGAFIHPYLQISTRQKAPMQESDAADLINDPNQEAYVVETVTADTASLSNAGSLDFPPHQQGHYPASIQSVSINLPADHDAGLNQAPQVSQPMALSDDAGPQTPQAATLSEDSETPDAVTSPEVMQIATSTVTSAQQATIRPPPVNSARRVVNTPSPSKPTGGTTVRDAQSQIKAAFKPKPEPKLKASPAKNWKPQNYSADVSGLRTKDRNKMIDLADEKFKKELLKAVNFVREISDKDARDVPEVAQREKAFLLYLFLQSVAYEIEGKQNPVSTVIAQVSANAEGEKALATAKVQAAAKRLQFMCKAYYKPALDQLQSPNPKLTIDRVVDDFHTTAKVLFGDKPPTLIERVDPFMASALSSWKWEMCKEWQATEPREFGLAMAKLLDAFEMCRKSGSAYVAAVDSILPKIC